MGARSDMGRLGGMIYIVSIVYQMVGYHNLDKRDKEE